MKILFIIILLSVTAKTFSQIKSVDINHLVSLMEGTFSNKEQSQEDSAFDNIIIHSKKIWTDRTDGKWLYFEETDSDSIDKHVRNYVRQVTSTYEGRFRADDFLIPNSQNFAGEWMKENPLSELTPDSLNMINGCEVIYTLMNDTLYEGMTEGKDCRGLDDTSGYLISEVIITNDMIINWASVIDSDKNGNPLSTFKGRYFFKRIKE